MSFYNTVNNASAILTAPHTIGDGELHINPIGVFGSGGFPLRVTCFRQSDNAIVIYSIGSSGATHLNITGVLENTADIDLTVNDICQADITAGTFKDIHNAILAINASGGGSGGSGVPIITGTSGAIPIYAGVGLIEDTDFSYNNVNQVLNVNKVAINTIDPSGQLQVTPKDNNTPGVIIKGFSHTPSQEYLNIVTNSGITLVNIDRTGALQFNRMAGGISNQIVNRIISQDSVNPASYNFCQQSFEQPIGGGSQQDCVYSQGWNDISNGAQEVAGYPSFTDAWEYKWWNGSVHLAERHIAQWKNPISSGDVRPIGVTIAWETDKVDISMTTSLCSWQSDDLSVANRKVIAELAWDSGDQSVRHIVRNKESNLDALAFYTSSSLDRLTVGRGLTLPTLGIFQGSTATITFQHNTATWDTSVLNGDTSYYWTADGVQVAKLRTGGLKGWLTLMAPTGQANGAGIEFLSSGGAKTGQTALDSDGNLISKSDLTGGLYLDFGTGGLNFRSRSFASATRFNVNDNGMIGLGSNALADIQAAVRPISATTKGLVVRAFTGQSANLLELQTSSGTVPVSFNSNGTQMIFGGANATIYFNAAQTSYFQYDGANMNFGSPNSCQYFGVNHFFKNVSGSTEHARFTAAGFGVNETSPSAQIHITTGSSSRRVIIARGAANQTANLFEGQTDSGAVVASISASGLGTFSNVSASGLRTSIVSVSSNYTINNNNDMVLVDATAAPVVITLLNATTIGNGREFTIKKIDSSSNAVAISGVSAQTIDGDNVLSFSSRWNSYTIKSFSGAWYIK